MDAWMGGGPSFVHNSQTVLSSTTDLSSHLIKKLAQWTSATFITESDLFQHSNYYYYYYYM
jgi:hypothetical protein